MPAMDHEPSALAPQEFERSDFAAEGLRRLQELRLMKHMRLQQQLAQQQHPPPQHAPAAAAGPPASPRSISSTSSGSGRPPLSRSASMEPSLALPPQQRLQRSTSTSMAPLPLPQRIARSSSMGSYGHQHHHGGPAAAAAANAAAPWRQQQQAASVLAAGGGVPPTRASLAAAAMAAGAGGGAPAWGAAAARQPARHSEPSGMTADPLVDMLLAEVESLLAERQQLAARCSSLTRDNEQLAELVGRLSLMLQEQHGGGGVVGSSHHHPHAHLGGGAGSSAAYMSAALGGMQGLTGLVSLAGGQHAAHKQFRVSEWLERRNTPAEAEWAAWQQQLPLEHMHSGSSSTLTASLLEQQQ